MSVAEEAKAVYEADYRDQLEADHFGKFVAIEPLSRDSFVAETFIEAALAAKDRHPNFKFFVIRVRGTQPLSKLSERQELANGNVDDNRRALLKVPILNSRAHRQFDGHFVFSVGRRTRVAGLILADQSHG